jgi:hypothetical protein
MPLVVRYSRKENGSLSMPHDNGKFHPAILISELSTLPDYQISGVSNYSQLLHQSQHRRWAQ